MVVNFLEDKLASARLAGTSNLRVSSATDFGPVYLHDVDQPIFVDDDGGHGQAVRNPLKAGGASQPIIQYGFSTRFFTCCKNLAAGAPSTIR